MKEENIKNSVQHVQPLHRRVHSVEGCKQASLLESMDLIVHVNWRSHKENTLTQRKQMQPIDFFCPCPKVIFKIEDGESP